MFGVLGTLKISENIEFLTGFLLPSLPLKIISSFSLTAQLSSFKADNPGH
jgi:hypothetical protein